jgi:membrane protease YdiL (CAAX protease family)
LTDKTVFWHRLFISFPYLIAISCAELMTPYEVRYGIAFHALILFALFIHSALTTDKELSGLLMALIIAPLIRILSLSTPIAQFHYILWFAVISIPVFIAIFACMFIQHLKSRDVGLALPELKYLHIQLATILAAAPFGIFRGLMQYHATRTMGFYGIVFVSAVFGVLHVGNLSVLDVLLAATVGFAFSLVVRKTGSIFGVTISHGLINTVLFLIAPHFF